MIIFTCLAVETNPSVHLFNSIASETWRNVVLPEIVIYSYNLILNKGIYFNINIPSLNYAACSSNQPKNMEPLSHSNVGHGNMASWPKTRDTGNKFGTSTLFSDIK